MTSSFPHSPLLKNQTEADIPAATDTKYANPVIAFVTVTPAANSFAIGATKARAPPATLKTRADTIIKHKTHPIITLMLSVQLFFYVNSDYCSALMY